LEDVSDVNEGPAGVRGVGNQRVAQITWKGLGSMDSDDKGKKSIDVEPM
jgi:hypothetical protein